MDKLALLTFIGKISKTDLINFDLFIACLDDVCEMTVSYNGSPATLHPAELVALAAEHCRWLLNSISPNFRLNFRGVDVNQYLPIRDQLLSQLAQLTVECVGE
jgi:hypothetical protein